MSTYPKKAEPPKEVTLRARIVLGNKRYADEAMPLVREIIESARALGIKLDKVSLKDWWMLQSRGSPRPEDRGNRNIRLVSRDKAKIMLFNGSSWSRYEIDIRVPRIYSKLFEVTAELGMNCKLSYLARIIAIDMSYDRAYCELQVSIPYDLYLEYRRRYSRPLGSNIAGIDVNVDRVNLAIVGRNGVLRDVKTFHHPSLASTTLKGVQRRSLINKLVHGVLKHVYYHGVSIIVLEDPEILDYLKSRWIRGSGRRNSRYNRRVSVFK